MPHTSSAGDRERYLSLFNHTPNAAFSLDLEGNYEAVNSAAVAMTGYSEAEFLSMNFASVIHPDDLSEVLAAFADVAIKQPRSLECTVLRKDGSTVDIFLTGLPVIVDGEVISVHGVAEDITERRRALAAIEEARRMAEHANTVKSLFLANVSHELRTPLASTIAALEMLEDVDLPNPGGALLDTAQRSGERLMRLVDDLLDYISLAAGGARLRSSAFDVRAMVTAAVEAVGPAAQDHQLELVVDVDDDLPHTMVGDPPRLTQALNILLQNAVKFTDAGRVEVRVEVSDPGLDVPLVCFEVVDTGIGIEPELQPDLFEPFVQEDGTITRRFGGTGLGLAIFRELVGLMDGTYNLISAPGEGTTVAITVPLGVDKK